MLRTAQSFRLFGTECRCDCAVRPGQPPFRGLVDWPEPWRRDRKDAAFAFNQNVARIGCRGRDECNPAGLPRCHWLHTHSAKVRVFPKPRPASNNQTCHQSSGGGRWFGRATAGQEFSSASASCTAKELAIDRSSFGTAIFELRFRSTRRIEIAKCRNYGLSAACGYGATALTIRAIAFV